MSNNTQQNGNIPILHAVRRNRERRETDDEKIDGWYTSHQFRLNLTEIHLWIDEFTTGRFYLTPLVVAFEDAKDFTIFKLWHKND